MNPYAKIAVAAAAVLIVAVVGYNLLPGSSTGVGGPAPSPSAVPTATPTGTPSPTGAFGGIVRYKLNGAPVTTEINAVANGASAFGTAVTAFRSGTHTVRLACAAQDGDFWVLGGTTERSTVEGEPVGTWSAVIVREGSPQQIAIWLSADAPAGSDCDGFLASHDFADLDPGELQPVESGALVPPPDLAP